MSDGPVVVLGDVMSDVSARLAAPPVPGSDTAAVVAMRPGGGGANAAAWLAWLGVPVVLAGRVGDDEAGRGAARALAAAGVTARLAVAPGATGACVVIVGLDGERTMLTDAGANARLAAGDLPTTPSGPEPACTCRATPCSATGAVRPPSPPWRQRARRACRPRSTRRRLLRWRPSAARPSSGWCARPG